MDPTRLDTALAAEFGGTDAHRRAVVRAAGDLSAVGKAERDRGQPLDVETVITHLGDAPDGSTLVERWNWWLGALDIAYGGYSEFSVQFTAGDETAEPMR